ncbi:hypothetical protein ACJX0J_019687, partial [Zea mays]
LCAYDSDLQHSCISTLFTFLLSENNIMVHVILNKTLFLRYRLDYTIRESHMYLSAPFKLMVIGHHHIIFFVNNILQLATMSYDDSSIIRARLINLLYND